MTLISKFNESDCKKICSIIKEYCTGGDIYDFLNELNFYDIQSQNSPIQINYSKTDRLLNAIMDEQTKCNNGSPMIKLIEKIYNPMRFINTRFNWNNSKDELNSVIQFLGFQLNDSGKIIQSKKVESYTEAEQRCKSLKSKLLANNIHYQVLEYCKTEYLDKNYFHCILEASKGVFDRIRTLSTIQLDGNKLINIVFNEKYPIIVFNSLQTEEEKNEFLGFKYLLKSVTCLFRNPKAHNPKLYSYTSEQDALMVLNIISYVFTQLDKCSLNTYALQEYRKSGI